MARKLSKAHRRHSLRRTHHRGGFYGFSGGIAPGAMAWSRGNEVSAPDYVKVPVTGGRRRKTKVIRKGRKGRKTRKMKGGAYFSGPVSASYQGTGARGIADFKGVDTKGPYTNGGSGGGAFNDFGAKPGSSF